MVTCAGKTIFPLFCRGFSRRGVYWTFPRTDLRYPVLSRTPTCVTPPHTLLPPCPPTFLVFHRQTRNGTGKRLCGVIGDPPARSTLDFFYSFIFFPSVTGVERLTMVAAFSFSSAIAVGSRRFPGLFRTDSLPSPDAGIGRVPPPSVFPPTPVILRGFLTLGAPFF